MIEQETFEEVKAEVEKTFNEGKPVMVNNRATRRAFFHQLKRGVWKELNKRWKQSGVGN